MKKKKEVQKKKLPKGFSFKPGLGEEYKNQPLFKEKLDRANHILRTIGLPKTDLG